MGDTRRPVCALSLEKEHIQACKAAERGTVSPPSPSLLRVITDQNTGRLASFGDDMF